jgi:1-deoxy-D-xylulose-5-phosphate reductoisomerase
MKKIVILGSTGSIGENTLFVARKNPDKIKVTGLSTRTNIELLLKQIEEFKPPFVAVWDERKADELKKKVSNKVTVLRGQEGLVRLSEIDSDLVVSSLVGSVGLKPTLTAINTGKNIALANKEVLVMAGEIVKKAAKKNKVSIIPIDSEHSALLQCLWKRDREEVKKVILTASGGPFYNKNTDDLSKINPKQALMHPTWKMGPKVTIDSATLMNKGFEVIEARYLFDIPVEKIDVVIHPESIVHAIVEFVDGSVSACMHIPDMRIPIQYALSYPERWKGDYGAFDITRIGALHFLKPDIKKFPALGLACNAVKTGGAMPAVMSAADEVCVEKFLKSEISFLDIIKYVKKTMEAYKPVKNPSMNDILEKDKWARKKTLELTKTVMEV